MVGLHQVANQFSGTVIKGTLHVKPKSDDVISLQIQQFQQAEVHANLSNGWSTYLKDHEVNYKPLPISEKPFELYFKNGVVDKMIVDKQLPTWEVNILKAIASQLQVDTQAENLKGSKINQVPGDGQFMGVYKTIEDTVTGEFETIYDISPLPEYVLQSRPELAPLQHLRGEGQFIDIIKTKNYSNSEQRMAYHFGITGLTDWEPASNQMGSFLSRSSISRIILSGTMKNYVIQSSVTTNKIILAPHLYNNQKGIVASRLNLTLEEATQSSGSPQPVPNPREIENLVYEYNAATQDEHAQNHHTKQHRTQGEQGMDSSSSSSSSENSSSSSSSEEHPQANEDRIRPKRSMRSQTEKRQTHYGGSSSSSSESHHDLSDSSSSSSSTSSSEEFFWQSKPKLNKAPNTPLMPYFVGNQGNSILASKDINAADAVQKIAQQIGEEVQNGESITGENTLSKFSILTLLIHTMDEDQLQQATQKLYFPYSQASQKSSQDAVKHQAWSAYRDAVAQAGTGPALLAIKQWIKEGKITGEEAAEVVGVLSDTARYPTTEYMDAFFELVKSEQVQQQWQLNTTALISFTDLVRKAQVNKDTSHNRYPVHSFGRLAPKSDKTVAEKYIPYLEQQLKKAVQQGDSPRIQTYIRALGNTAHQKILAVFEPYLEGQQPMSEFQRFTIVASLDKLTKVNPSLARSVLFKIYQNSGEAPQIRVAAVMQLMKTNPPRQILQRMAQHTNYDHSIQVNAAVKSAIENAARLQGPKSSELAENAKSAVHLLTTKEFGYHQSYNFIRDYVVEEQELMYKSHFAYIHGEDSIVPRSGFYSVWRNLGGYKRQPMQFSWMTSGTGDLMDLLSEQFSNEQQKTTRREQSSEWSMEQIQQLLKLQGEQGEQVEGNVLVSLFGAKRLFAFDNHTIEQLPNYIKYAAKRLQNGQSFNFTKMYNQYSIQLAFPTETGLPFFYTFTTPTRAYIGGEIKAKSNPDMSGQQGDEIKLPESGTVQGEIELMYTVKTEGVYGFSTPYDHKAYVAGLGKNLHVSVPMRAEVYIDQNQNTVETMIQPLETTRKQKLFEYSTVAFTSKHDILDLSPIVDGRDAQKIHVRPVQRIQATVGQQSTGFAFEIKAESEQKFIDMATVYKALERHDAISAILFGDYEHPINNNNFTITYNPQESSAQRVKLALTYAEHDVKSGPYHSLNKHRLNKRQQGSGNAAIPTSTTPQDQQRQKEFIEKAGGHIKDSYTQMVDISVQFDGEGKAEYVATAAYARSPVDKKSRYLVFLGKEPAQLKQGTSSPYQVALQIDTDMPNVPLTNYQKAFIADPTSYITVKINMGEDAKSGGQVDIQGKLKQSQERRDYVQRHPLSKLCEQQMQEGNYVLPACRNATTSASYLDQYKFTLNYQRVPDSLKLYIYKAYTIGRFFGYQHVNESISSGQQGQVQLDVQFENDLTAANISIETPVFTSEFKNVYVSDWIRSLVVVHPEYQAHERLGQHLFLSQQYPTCVVDKNQATTFNNRTYPINIGKCWHAMVHPFKRTTQENPQEQPQFDDYDFTVLVREDSSKQKELLILLGKDVIEVQPSGSSDQSGTVTVNGQKAEFSQETAAQFKKQNGDLLVQIYALPSGEVRLYAPETGIDIIFDGSAIKLQASNHFRNRVRGLCGAFNGEYSTDFASPKNCILKNPFEFAASYAIVNEACEGPAKELHEKSKNVPCFRDTVMLGDVISDREAGRQTESSRKHDNRLQAMGGKQSEEQCSKHRVKVIEQPGKTCFSLRPQITCSSKCKASKKMEKKVDFHCVANSSAVRHWVDMAKKGANPDFSQKPANTSFKILLPERCIPN